MKMKNVNDKQNYKREGYKRIQTKMQNRFICL